MTECTPCEHIINDGKCAVKSKDLTCSKGQKLIDGVCIHSKDLKCAPGKQFENGSCISTKLLLAMIKKYNEQYKDDKDKIVIVPEYEKFKTLNPSKYKRYYLCKLQHKLKNKCNDQTCWTALDIFNKLDEKDKDELENFTFLPNGPKGKFEWLNTTHIDESLKQYEKKYPEFTFLGAVPIDFDDLPYLGIKDLDLPKLIKSGKHKVGIIFNLDEHDQPGSHWVALYADLKKGQIYFFDSYGEEPEKRIRVLIRRLARFCINNMGIDLKNLDSRYSEVRHQRGGSECGVYSMSFILRLLDGETFDQISSERIPDDAVNACRAVYFK